jgi:DNA-binding MarR family transcriptional regulator
LSNEAEEDALTLRARRAEQALPEIARRLFTLDPDDALAQLPGAQLKVCSLLLGGARTMSQIGEELRISVSAVTQIADRLEKVGLVERRPGDREGDRRARYLALTAHGADLMESRRRCRVRRVAAALARLPEADQTRVVAALETLLSACRQAAPSPATGEGGL